MTKVELFVLILILLGVGQAAYGQDTCLCLSKGESIKEKVKYHTKLSKAVFVGKVVEVTEKEDEPYKGLMEVHFEVLRSWKNAKTKSVVVLAERFMKSTEIPYVTNCGYDFTVGKSYLVYARASGSRRSYVTGEWELITDSCSRNSELNGAQDDLKALGKPKWISK